MLICKQSFKGADATVQGGGEGGGGGAGWIYVMGISDSRGKTCCQREMTATAHSTCDAPKPELFWPDAER